METRLWRIVLASVTLLLLSISCAGQQTRYVTPLLRAIRDRNAPEASRLIAEGNQELDYGDSDGSTALLEALRWDLETVVEQLVAAGADPNLKDLHGMTPLMQSAWYCRSRAIPLLFARGARPDDKDHDGYTALMYAASHCADGKAVTAVLRGGADVNLQTESKQTALMLAAFYGMEKPVQILIRAGANARLKNEDGETALTIAEQRLVGRTAAHDQICVILRKALRQKRTTRNKAALRAD
jgi:ankyrin repeat protein